MSCWRLDIAYDGRDFRGWARQPGQRTVQEEVERALGVALRQKVRLTVAGRTDAGVHAWGQVASFELADGVGEAPVQPGLLKRSLNALTPADLAVTGVKNVAAGFDARRDARARRYCYRLDTGSPPDPFERGRALWWPYPLDRGALGACAEALVGQHDFTAFTPTKTDHVHFARIVYEAEWREAAAESRQRGAAGPVLEFWIEADAFMRSMVRTLVGTMLEVGGGRRGVADFEALLAGVPRSQSGETAPPHGLYLAAIRY